MPHTIRQQQEQIERCISGGVSFEADWRVLPFRIIIVPADINGFFSLFGLLRVRIDRLR